MRGLASRSAASRNISKTRSLASCPAASSRLASATAASASRSREGGDGVGRLPELDLFLGAVAGGVRRRVAAGAVGDRVEQHRAAALEQDLLLAPESVDHRQRIVAVDALGVHLLGVDPGADARDELQPMVSPTGWPPMP